jgi:signal peptidase
MLSRFASAGLMMLAAPAALLLLVPAALGWQRYAIVSGSMTGPYDKGSLVLDDVVPVDALKVDVITYRPPAGDHLLTHRIAWIGRDARGRLFRTKGDANAVADPWTFRLDRPTQARVRAGIPYAGYPLTALGRRDVRLAVIGLPALLIAALQLAGLWRRLGAVEATA